ncbi:MAG: DUF983 domain-containing protein [Bacteroidota bacterium]|jgi:uncharacterized protein (DUF983 family)|nr:DUF983 domain-containing protein [Bacteroidota bacterium]
MQKKSKFQAIIEGKCPRCRQGDLFTYPINNISRFAKTNEHCPVCNVRFEQEPGFFFGAMYISYAICVAILVTAFVVINFFFEDAHILVYVISVPLIVIIALPLIFRYSRIFYLYLIGGIYYDERYSNN